MRLNRFKEKEDTSDHASDIPSKISKEFNMFEATGMRSKSLEFLYKAIANIPPTTVESERAFSAAGLFITKLRCRMSDESINAMCILRSHFQSKQ